MMDDDGMEVPWERGRDRLLLPETKVVYQVVSQEWWGWGLPFRHLLMGLLKAFEEWLLEVRVKHVVDQAVAEYASVVPESPGKAPPVYSEGGSGFYDFMRLTAPYRSL